MSMIHKSTEVLAAKWNETLEMLAIKLHEIEAIKFGSFLTESGLTPICFNFGSIIGHPDVLVSKMLINSIENRFIKTFFFY